MSKQGTSFSLFKDSRFTVSHAGKTAVLQEGKAQPDCTAGCQACAKLCPGMTGEQGHKAPWSHRLASPRALLLHQSDFQQQEIWITQAHGDAEAETKS